jgi:ferrous iron transport protein B
LGYFPRGTTDMTLAQQQEQSYIGQIGKVIEPIIRPLGFDWKLGVGLITGVGAKELVVSTLGVLYTNNPDTDSADLAHRIPITPLIAFGYMLFSLLYFPCLPTLTAIRHESGHWRWAIFTACYTTALAWLLTFAVYQIGLLFT